jgi:hypothetical protein
LIVTDVLDQFDVPGISAADAAATRVEARPAGESVDRQEIFRPLSPAQSANAAPGLSQAPRRRGRPLGSVYPDGHLVEEMYRVLPSVPTLRQAARLMAPHAHRYGCADPESTVRRLERRYRAERST